MAAEPASEVRLSSMEQGRLGTSEPDQGRAAQKPESRDFEDHGSNGTAVLARVNLKAIAHSGADSEHTVLLFRTAAPRPGRAGRARRWASRTKLSPRRCCDKGCWHQPAERM
jgi:hypothetical protein